MVSMVYGSLNSTHAIHGHDGVDARFKFGSVGGGKGFGRSMPYLERGYNRYLSGEF